jgi:hypothetical protein
MGVLPYTCIEAALNAGGWFEILEGGRQSGALYAARPSRSAETRFLLNKHLFPFLQGEDAVILGGRLQSMTSLPGGHDFPRHGHIKKRVADSDLMHVPTDPAFNVLCHLPDFG